MKRCSMSFTELMGAFEIPINASLTGRVFMYLQALEAGGKDGK